MTPTDAELELARQRWLRDFELLLVYRVDSPHEAAGVADAWSEQVAAMVNPNGAYKVIRSLQVPVRPGAFDVRTRQLGSRRGFAEASVNLSEVAGGVCQLARTGAVADIVTDFSIWPEPSDPGEEDGRLYVALTSPFWAFDAGTRTQVLDVADAFVAERRFVYGQVGASSGDKPALLQRLPAALGRVQAWQRDVQIGYDWVTYVRADLAAAVKPARLQQAAQRLHSVRSLSDGALRLQATERAEDYDARAACAVFDALVDVLPDGVPDPRPHPGFTPRWDWALLCHQDPKDFR